MTETSCSRRAQLQTLDDQALLARVIADDRIAFDLFFQRFRKLIVATAVRAGGVQLQSADVADVVAETLLAIVDDNYRKLRLYKNDGGCSVATWIAIIASTTARGYLRKRRSRRPPDALKTTLLDLAPIAASPDEVVLERQQRRLIADVLRSFSARDRQFVQLYYLRAMPVAAIALELGLSLATVYSKKAKIEARLRIRTRGMSEDPPAVGAG